MVNTKLWVLLFLLATVACSNSHPQLHFETAKIYSAGNEEIDNLVEDFKQTHNFEHMQLSTVDLASAEVFASDRGAKQKASGFHFAAFAHTLTNQIDSFYMVNLYDANYQIVHKNTDLSFYTIDIEAVDREGVVKRIIKAQIINDQFIIIDAY